MHSFTFRDIHKRFMLSFVSGLLLMLGLFFSAGSNAQVLHMSDFAIFGGGQNCPSGPGQKTPAPPGCAVMIGVGSIVNGNVGSYHLVRTNGDVKINGNIHSGGIVQLGNVNTAGKVTAANGDLESGDIFHTGSKAKILGDVDVNGDINIVNTGNSSSVAGKVTHFIYSYSGPVPVGGESFLFPSLPTLPVLPAITSLTCPTGSATDITTTQIISPGSYDELKLGGGKMVTFAGPGDYYFNSIQNSGGTNFFLYDLMGTVSGQINIYICGDVDLGKINTQFINGTADENRIFFEGHGNGDNNGGSHTYSFIIGSGSDFTGIVWAPYAAIKVGSGSCCTFVTGALWSATQVDIEHGVTITHNSCKGSVTITKILDGAAPAQDWAYTSDIPGHENFTLPANGGTITFTGISSGNFKVAEINQDIPGTSPVRQYTASNTCGPADTAYITINECENESCTFTNTCRGRIKIIKKFTGTPPVADWAYTSTIPGHTNFSIPKAGGSISFDGIDPGTYNIIEINQDIPGSNPVRQYTVSNSCGEGNSSTITINGCEDDSCTFTNSCKGRIKIIKKFTGTPPVADWAYTSTIPGHTNFSIPKAGGSISFDGVDPGTYNVTEINQDIPGSNPVRQYTVSNSCGQGNSSTITVSGCEDDSCTFTNSCKGIIRITKNVISDCATNQVEWNFTSNIPGYANFTINTSNGNTGTKEFTDLDPFTYTITEIVPPGWQSSTSCPQCTSTTSKSLEFTIGACEEEAGVFSNTNLGCNFNNCQWCDKSAVLSQVFENTGNSCTVPDILVDVRLPHNTVIDGSNTDVVDASEVGTGKPATWSIQAAVNYLNAHPGPSNADGQLFIGVTASDGIDPATCQGFSCARPPSGDNPYGTENVIVTNLNPERLNIFGCSVTMHAKDVNLPVITVKDGVGKVTILDLHVWYSKVAGYLIDNNADLVVVKNSAAYHNKLGYDARSGEIQLTGSQHVIANDTGIIVRGNNVKLRSMHDITGNAVGIKITGSGNTQVTDGSEVGTNGHPNGLGILVTGNNNKLHGDDADFNTGNGIEVTGCGNTLDEESAQNNGGTGIKVTCALNSNILHGNDADNNGGNGIFACGQVNNGGNTGSGNATGPDVVFVCAGPVKFIVTDKSADKAFKYDASFVLGSSAALHANNKDAYDAADDGIKTYVVDKNFKVYSYVGATKTESPKILKEKLGGNLSSPTGLAISGNDMWVADESKKKLYKYSLSAVFTGPAGNINALSEIPFTGNNANAGGLFISGTNLYVLDDNDKQFYRYPTAGGAGVASKVMKDNSGSSLGSPSGATLDGATVYVVDNNKDKVYSYSLATLFSGSGNLNSGTPFTLDAGNGDATGIAVGAAGTFPARSVDVQTADASDNLQSASLFVYPNPAHNNVTIQFMSIKDAKYSMNLVDQLGRTVMTDFIQAKQGLNTHELSLGKYARGMYLLILKNDNEKLQKKILVE